MTTSARPEPALVDTTNCDREPIRIPGSIQPHGVLLVLSPADLSVLQASRNVDEWLGISVERLISQSLDQVLGEEVMESLRPALRAAPRQARPVLLTTLSITHNDHARTFKLIAHQTDGGIVVELEATSSEQASAAIYPLADAFSLQIEQSSSLEDLCQRTAAEVQRLTGFDRVLIYRFDEQYAGTVIGEAGRGRLPSLLEHRFPASDIPAQARELYRLNRLRLIPDSGYRPVPIVPAVNPVTGQPLDMTYCTLRSVSPVHVEYMRNMETASSMSVSILRGEKLWGLISCHHTEPRTITFEARAACDLYGRMFSLRLAALEHSRDYERRIEVRSVYSRLLAAMADRLDYAAALGEHPDELLALADATGAAVMAEGQCLLVGNTPPEDDVRKLADWLFHQVGQEVYSTDALPAQFPDAAAFKDRACGLLAIAVSKMQPGYVLWFRPEVIQTIRWGGDPRKPVTADSQGPALHPRRSFETWKETVRDKSLAWKQSEIEGAQELRNAIVGSVLRKTEQLAQLNAELTRSNNELEAFSYSVSHDLRAPLRHISGYAEMLVDDGDSRLSPKGQRCVRTIMESSQYAGMLVDKLLAFSRMGRVKLDLTNVEMNALVADAQQQAMTGVQNRAIHWQIATLPSVRADVMMLREAVVNLLENAVKYTRQKEHAEIEVGYREEAAEHLFWVRDNGAGFDQQYAGKLFGVFQRLHRIEDYEGTGIGLANVRRVMERHGGRTWAEGQEGRGAIFYFSLPKLHE